MSRPLVPAPSVSDFSTIYAPKNRQDFIEGSTVGSGKAVGVFKTGRQFFKAGLAAKQAGARQLSPPIQTVQVYRKA